MGTAKKSELKRAVTVIALVAIAAAAVFYALDPVEESAREEVVDSPNSPRKQKVRRDSVRTKSSRKSAPSQARRKAKQRKIEEAGQIADAPKPAIQVDGIGFDELDEMQKAILAELRAALDLSDIRAVRASIAKMRKMGEALALAEHGDRVRGPGGHLLWTQYVPLSMRQSAVEALGWFGKSATADLVEFIADEDPSVSQSAMDQFEQAMQDPSYGDRERAEVIKMMSTALSDEDAIDWMCMEVNNMRHSVGIDTLLYMSNNGTDAVREKVPETMEFFTGEETVKTEADAKQWLEENPDDPDDDEFYGPMETGD